MSAKAAGRTPAFVARTGIALAAAVAVLGGCASPVPTPHAEPVPAVDAPVLDETRLSQIASRIGQQLEAADGTLDPAALQPILTGPALTMRTAQYTVAAAASDPSGLTEIPDSLESGVVPTTQTWPRSTFGVTVQPEDLQAQRLVAYTQSDARSQYQMWGWVRLFPDVTVPQFAGPQEGAAPLVDSSGLALSVADAVSQYADVLTNPDGSAYAGTFADDPLRQQFAKTRTDMTAAYQAIEGSYALTVSVSGDPATYPALRTFDGGAVVMATLEAAEVGSAPDGATISPDAATTALLAGAAVSNHLTVRHTLVVALYVPPAGAADATVHPIGAEDVRTGAEPA